MGEYGGRVLMCVTELLPSVLVLLTLFMLPLGLTSCMALAGVGEGGRGVRRARRRQAWD